MTSPYISNVSVRSSRLTFSVARFPINTLAFSNFGSVLEVLRGIFDIFNAHVMLETVAAKFLIRKS